MFLELKRQIQCQENRDRRYITDYEFAIWLTMPKAKWTFNRQEDTYQRPKFIAPIDKGLHPTQKPYKTMKEILEIHTNKDDTVLDCFAGSFTTCLAAQNLGRKSIGIELDKKYCDTGVKRLKK